MRHFFCLEAYYFFGLSLSGERDKITDKFFSYTEPDICCALFAFEPNFHWAQCFIRKCIKQMKVYRKHKGPYLFMLQMQSDGIFSNLLIFFYPFVVHSHAIRTFHCFRQSSRCSLVKTFSDIRLLRLQ